MRQTNPSAESGYQRQLAIERIWPELDGGRFPVKRIVGDRVRVEADVFADGSDCLNCQVLFRRAQRDSWTEEAMVPIGNDRWRGEFSVEMVGRYYYRVLAWIDLFGTWLIKVTALAELGQVSESVIKQGIQILSDVKNAATPNERVLVDDWTSRLRLANRDNSPLPNPSNDLLGIVRRCAPRSCATVSDQDLAIVVDRKLARFSAWYEMFPRSCGKSPRHHGTFWDCEAALPYIASMGFDVLYLPPIHPIGARFRKGKNDTMPAHPEDVGSCWAIGSSDGGHKDIHPALGTFADFQHLIRAAEALGIEIALDLAFQCSPDHPYVTQHPEWFKISADGTILCAENLPKVYHDVYPFDFECKEWHTLWEELRSVVVFWIAKGIRLFRVDNPHTKPFPFWEWLIETVKLQHPDIVFLAEAFTRPLVARRIAKVGFSQSYTYFAWRNSKQELTDYFSNLTCRENREYFRPHLWPNTPDILTSYLQVGGQSAFVVRLLLAATLGSAYGIYGPAFELCENTALSAGSEEYRNSEKYEVRHWNLASPISIYKLIRTVNQIRRENAALHSDAGLRFHTSDNRSIICYSKTDETLANVLLFCINLDPLHMQSSTVFLDLDVLGLNPTGPYTVDDLLTSIRYTWTGSSNYVELTPGISEGHVFRISQP